MECAHSKSAAYIIANAQINPVLQVWACKVACAYCTGIWCTTRQQGRCHLASYLASPSSCTWQKGKIETGEFASREL